MLLNLVKGDFTFGRPVNASSVSTFPLSNLVDNDIGGGIGQISVVVLPWINI